MPLIAPEHDARTLPPLRRTSKAALVVVCAGIAALATACESVQPLHGGDRVAVVAPGANGAACELADQAGNRYSVPSTPGAVTLRPGGGALTVHCRKPGFRDGVATIAPGQAGGGVFSDISYFLGFSDQKPTSSSGYPAEIAVAMNADGGFPATAAGSLPVSGNAALLGVAPPEASGPRGPMLQPPASQMASETTAPTAPAYAGAYVPGAPAQSRAASGGALMGDYSNAPIAAGRSASPVATASGDLSPSQALMGGYSGMRSAAAPPMPSASDVLPQREGTAQAAGDQVPAASDDDEPTEAPQARSQPRRSRAMASSGPATNGSYALQVGAYREKQNAEQMAAVLRSRGYQPRVVAGGNVFRVRIGGYASADSARSAAAEFSAKENLQATPVRN
ncbi:MAG: SPOR domain-containing protein [Alphaproteobacteria bacterium]|nr:SPOR domain-containing protein [Alphaproteobacteria bacterium]